MFAAARIVPLYAQPRAGSADDIARVADSSQIASKGDTGARGGETHSEVPKKRSALLFVLTCHTLLITPARPFRC